MLVTDTFKGTIFKDSLKKELERNEAGQLKMGFGAVLQVQTCREVKVSGAFGCLSSAQKKGACVAETEIGVSGTSAWKLNSLGPNTSVAIVFEIVNQHNQPVPQGQLRYTQFVTDFTNSAGQPCKRVTTVAQPWTSPENSLEVSMSFDQEAAAVVMARYAAWKSESEEQTDVLRWVDRMLIRLCAKFGSYRKDDSMSFNLPEQFGLYPQFMYNLRRSPFLQAFNSSPDETAFYHVTLMREDINNLLLMIQPFLLSYSLTEPP
jgi:protein transport protein SEC23